MSGWNVQAYGKFPASVKVCRQEASEAIEPESKERAVAVWGVISAFFHSTVSPFFTSSSGGSNFMFFMATFATTGAFPAIEALLTLASVTALAEEVLV